MRKFSTIALIVAAGNGTRFGAALPKQYAKLAGKPVLFHSIAALTAHKGIDAVAVVIHSGHAGFYQEMLSGKPIPTLLPPIHGGAERQDSVRLGLEAIAQYQPTRVLIHDAARPGLTSALIDRLLACPAEAVIPVLPVADTIKRLLPEGQIAETLDRSMLVRAQTPQCFDYAALLSLHRTSKAPVTDDAALFEAASKKVHTVMGEPANLKITTPEDWEIMRSHFEISMETRTGMGFDVHKFGPASDHIMLCGIPIPHNRGLEGHSDADVGLHALVDALLGAGAQGDIGQHFPPTDAKWKGADSGQFVTYTRELIAGKGGLIRHVDVTLICEKPKVGPHREAMRTRIAELLQIDLSRVSVKATTTEKLGFTGREEGIAAQAIATLHLPA